jgi:hypothetical protein
LLVLTILLLSSHNRCGQQQQRAEPHDDDTPGQALMGRNPMEPHHFAALPASLTV